MLSLFAASIASLDAVMAADVEIPGSNLHNAHQNAGEEIQYRFRQKTQVRVNSSVPIDVIMDVDAMEIGEKSFSVEITDVTEDDKEIELNMTCRENEEQLGVQAGALVRNRNRVRMNYGFAVNLTANQTCTAELKLSMSAEEAKGAAWAYFDEAEEEWVPVESEYVDGELVAITEHFSVWTIISSVDYTMYIVIGVAGLVAVGIIFAIKKKH